MSWILVTATQFTKKLTDSELEILNIVKYKEDEITKYRVQRIRYECNTKQ
jgi:chromosome segregation and condensation protein ScpB